MSRRGRATQRRNLFAIRNPQSAIRNFSFVPLHSVIR
jgi:hypothetical protein